MLRGQLSLLGHDEPAFDAECSRLRRIELARGAWVDYAQGWLQGDAAVFEHLARTIHWRSSEQRMYDKIVRVPRTSSTADSPPARSGNAPRRAGSRISSRR